MGLRPELRQAHVASGAGLQKQAISRLLTAGKITPEKGARRWAWLLAEGSGGREFAAVLAGRGCWMWCAAICAGLARAQSGTL
jgi:hypothetical protein